MVNRALAAGAATVILLAHGLPVAPQAATKSVWSEPTRLKPQSCGAPSPVAPFTTQPVYIPSQLAFIDPVTGKRTEPTAEQLRNWIYFHGISDYRRTVSLLETTVPGGGFAVRLDGLFDVPVVRFLDQAEASSQGDSDD